MTGREKVELFGTGSDYDSGALFSECRTWRYALWRRWGEASSCVFVGLNPSTADEHQDDPTIRRCIGFAKAWGFGGVLMLNAFGFRSTDPKGLKMVPDPVGPSNDRAIRSFAINSPLVIVAWGAHCPESRQEAVLAAIGRPVKCLGTTKAGRPKHPLYLRADTEPVAFEPNKTNPRKQE